MILELSDIRIQPGTHDQFDTAIEGAISLTIAKAVGYLGHHAHKDIESPEHYVLTVHWNTLKNHTTDFRGSPAFTEWRGIVGPFFAAPPTVEHFSLLKESE